MRRLHLVGLPVLGVCAIAALGFGLVATLPSPSPADRLAVRALERLDTTRGKGGQMVLASRSVDVSCRRLPGSRHLILLSDGTELVLSGTHVHTRIEEPSLRMLAAVTHTPEVTAAEADLSGSYTLYARQLGAQLATGHVTVAPATMRGRRVYRIRLTRNRPTVDLYVARTTLRPLAVAFRSSVVTGFTVLSRSARLDSRRAC